MTRGPIVGDHLLCCALAGLTVKGGYLTDSALWRTLRSLTSSGRSFAWYGLPAKARNSERLTSPFPCVSKRFVANFACWSDIPSSTPILRKPSSKSDSGILPVPSFELMSKHALKSDGHERHGERHTSFPRKHHAPRNCVTMYCSDHANCWEGG